MKRLLLILCVTVAAIAATAKTAPEMTFTATSHDFGNIAEDGGPVKCEFVFTNTGDAPLVIVSASASCGCTKPGFPKEPIMPGKTGKITVTFFPQGHPGEINKDVKVRTNVPGKKRQSLKLRGMVIPAKKK